MWNTLHVDISLNELVVRPVLGPGGLTDAEAHSEVQSALDAEPAWSRAAERWRTHDAPQVRVGSLVWTTYEYDDDPRGAALAWINAALEDFRNAGVDIRVADPPG